MNRKLTCVDLFCGAGGFSRGFLDAGYDVVLGVDYDDAALETFQRNHGNTHAMKLDLYDEKNIDVIVQYLKSIGISDLDVLIGGPPCQGFSYAGKMEIDDKRNFLYLAMVKLTERLKPKAVLLENVLALVEAHGGVGAKRIIDDFSAIGYNMTKEVLFAPEYGVPQLRKRVFFVGLRNTEQEFEFPTAILDAKHYVTTEEAISDLPSLQDENGMILRGSAEQDYMTEPASEYQRIMRNNMRIVHNHIGAIPIEKTRKMIALVPEGKNYLALPDEYRDLMKEFKFNLAFDFAWGKVQDVNKQIDDDTPWSLAKNGETRKLNEVLNSEISNLLIANKMLEPFLPETSAKIAQIFTNPIEPPKEPLFPKTK